MGGSRSSCTSAEETLPSDQEGMGSDRSDRGSGSGSPYFSPKDVAGPVFQRETLGGPESHTGPAGIEFCLEPT